MNVARIFAHKSVLTIFLVAGALALALRFALTPLHVIVFCDQRFPMDMQTAIKQIVEMSHVRTMGAAGLCKELQKEYISVASVIIAYKGSLTAHVIVTAQVPAVCFQSPHVGQAAQILCKTGAVIDKKYFNELMIDGMPTIAIEGSDFIQKIADTCLIQCALRLKSELYQDYFITWKSKVEIVLQSRDSQSILTADAVTVHDGERFEYVKRIIDAYPELYSNGIKADIRLKDEIICAPAGKKAL